MGELWNLDVGFGSVPKAAQNVLEVIDRISPDKDVFAQGIHC